jgi:hypothetical protein
MDHSDDPGAWLKRLERLVDEVLHRLHEFPLDKHVHVLGDAEGPHQPPATVNVATTFQGSADVSTSA